MFWKNTLISWYKIYERENASNSEKTDMLEQPLWYNKVFRTDSKTVFKNDWYCHGIHRVRDLVKNEEQFLTQNELIYTFDIKCNFMEYHSLMSMIKTAFQNNINKYLLTLPQLAGDSLETVISSAEHMPPAREVTISHVQISLSPNLPQ